MITPQVMKIGIIGGGQLGKMMTQAAKKMGFYVQVLDPNPNCPASQVSDKHIVADFFDRKKLKELVLRSDVTTFDIERSDTYLMELVKEGALIYPRPDILEIIQDKTKQKELLEKHKIPTARYKKINALDIHSAIKEFGFPVVQKASRMGYDGRGVFVIKNKNAIQKALKAESFLEEYVDFDKELAINIARGTNGEIICFPVVEMIFDSKSNICDMVIAPARVTDKIKKKVEQIGIKTVQALGKGAVGVFGIEMFLTNDGKVLVNEIAPRPHNSGHYTIEACATSQFEQHIRAITGLPLGSTKLLTPAVMVNILGDEGHCGLALSKGMKEILAIPELSLHMYGKLETRPSRKMGHITVVDKDIKKAIKKITMAKKLFKVISKK